MELAGIDDAELVAHCRAGSEEAWEEFVERFSRYVYAIPARVYRLPVADTEDVFQEVFARAFERLDELRDDAAIRAWMAQLTRRLAVDRLRAAARERPSAEVPDPREVDETLSRIDEALVVRAALETLPDHCQEIVDRFFARDQSYRVIGEALAIPPGTIASRISRCLAKLRLVLEAS